MGSLPWRLSNVSKRMGLPVTLKMRHDAHYVEQLTSFSGAAVGRMIPVDKIRPNPDQPRKALGELRELTDSIKEKGVLEPLLVRFMPRDDCYHIISGERRYHASRAAGLREVACIENLQRKDLTPFEEADGLQRLAETFEYTHDDIAKKIAKARSSVTETMSLRVIPEVVRKRCLELGVVSKSVLLQVARQPNERKMLESVHRIAQGGLTRDEARRERQEEKNAGPRPQPFIFNFCPENEAFRLRIQFRKSSVSRGELIDTLRGLLQMLEQDQRSSPDADKSNPAVA